MYLFLLFPLFTNTITVKNYLKALCTAYPEKRFQELLHRKFIDKQSRAVIINKKYDTTEEEFINKLECDARLTQEKLEIVLEKNKKSDGIQKKRKDSVIRSKRSRKATPKYAETEE